MRALYHILRRFKVATLLNVLGLSVAFTAFIIIMIQVSYDLRFDASIPDADHVYRINTIHDGSRIAATPRPVGEGIGAYSPYVKAVAINNAMFATVFNRFFTIETEGLATQPQVYAEKMMETTPGFIDIFKPKMREGSAQALLEPGKVLIPQSMATRIFKDESTIGKNLRGEDFLWTVGGVYEDFPKNSSVHNFILLQLPKHNHWALNYETYVSIDPSQDANLLFAEYIETLKPQLESTGYGNVDFFLSPIKALHFDTSIGFDTVEKTSMLQIGILIGIAFIILLIAVINFTNYSIALAPLRTRGLNTQKVLGASRARLCLSLTSEAVLVCLISFGIALFLVHMASLISATNLLSSSLALSENISLLFVAGGAALLTGLFAGIYPSLYATSFEPAMVLKGNFGLSPRGRRLRATLVGIQYIASFFLIIAALFMYIQTKYMQHQNPGYDRSQMLVIPTNKPFANNHALFSQELVSLPSVESVGYSEALIASRDHFDVYQGTVKELQVILNTIRADVDFLQTMDIPLLDGRYFTSTDALAEGESFIILNERARKEYHLQLGDKIDGRITVVGFIPDVNYTSLRKNIEPMGFILDATRRFSYVRIKEGTNVYAAIRDIDEVLQRLSPGFPFQIRSLNDVAKESYAFESNMMVLIALFSFFAILLSMMGVFGLVIFESEYKRKEIGIRKVFGSLTHEILKMLNKKYFFLLAVGFIIAAPLAYFGVNIWLRGFAYKTPVYWWVFVLSFLIVASLTSAIVTFQSLRVANANPVDSLKTE
jgi:ABC-type antimicrobial peptide transport system, permease component